MSEMIERVAKSICKIAGEPEDCAKFYMGAARAAIEAMHNPTKEMEAAADALDDWGVPSDPGIGNASALAHWHAMIDEALK